VSTRLARTARLRTLARRHLERWGLVEPAVLECAAQRLAEAVLADPTSGDDGVSLGRMRALAERWIADFAGGCSDPERHWIWHAGALLRRFPATFLETPLPVSAEGAQPGSIAVLPERDPVVVKQQLIAGPLERVILALREALHRARPAVFDQQPQTLADSAG
jgi:hypothetical protein